MDQPTWIGRTLSGRYKIDAMLGQGGMSAVYKATDPNLKRVVAVKLIHAHLSIDPSFVLRFESEAAAVASLRHSNIVQVFDFNNDSGVYYMVLEFIPGETLQDRMKRLAADKRQIPLEDALKFTANIADAVGYSHQRGMVHRDIKPANIMLDVQGQAILMDFGIVKILGGDSHTSTGAVVGTARYMSPESIRGEVADHRSDIYSLGVTMYEMVSGRPPFLADSAMTLMMMHLNDPVPDVRGFRSEIPPRIVAILQKCLAKDRNDRYHSAADLSADLKHALAALSGPATSIQVKDSPSKPEAVTMTSERHALESRSHAQQLDKPAASAQPPSPAPVPVSQSYPQPKPVTTTTTATTPPPPSRAQSSSRRWMWAGGAVALFACCVVIALVSRFAMRSANRANGTQTPPASAAATATATTEAVMVAATDTPAPIVYPTDTEVSFTPTPSTPYVVITRISINDDIYIVDYEVHNFPDSPQLHVHMFFNTVPPEQAGSPASGPWKLTWGQYGDPPFTQYGVANRPAAASQMCALVANPNHSIILNTGNCVDLP